MMTMAHAAVGAAIARSQQSRLRGAASAFAAHALLDLPRHEDLERREESVLTLITIGLTAGLFGLRSREFWGGFFCASPDLEHLLPERHRGRLYPTHRWGRLHCGVPTPFLSAPTQVALAVTTLAVLRATRSRRSA